MSKRRIFIIGVSFCAALFMSIFGIYAYSWGQVTRKYSKIIRENDGLTSETGRRATWEAELNMYDEHTRLLRLIPLIGGAVEVARDNSKERDILALCAGDRP